MNTVTFKIVFMCLCLLFMPKLLSIDHQVESPFLGAVSHVCPMKDEGKFDRLKIYNVLYVETINNLPNNYTRSSIINEYYKHIRELNSKIDEKTCKKFEIFLDKRLKS